MQIKEINRSTTDSGAIVTEFEKGKMHIKLTSTYENQAALDELLYYIACGKIIERFNPKRQKRDNIVQNGGFGIIEVGK